MNDPEVSATVSTLDVEVDSLPVTSRLGKLMVLLFVGLLLLALQSIIAKGNPHGDLQMMRERLNAYHLGGGAGFFIVATVLTFAGMPRLVFFALGGFLMGFTEGFLIALCASVTGSFGIFALLRWSGRDWLTKRFGKRRFIKRLTAIEPTIFSVCMARQLPVSNLMINAGLGMSRVKSPAFLLGSLVGFIPQGAVASMIGSGASGDSASEQWVRMASAAVVIFGMGLWVWRGRQRRKAEVEGTVA